MNSYSSGFRLPSTRSWGISSSYLYLAWLQFMRRLSLKRYRVNTKIFSSLLLISSTHRLALSNPLSRPVYGSGTSSSPFYVFFHTIIFSNSLMVSPISVGKSPPCVLSVSRLYSLADLNLPALSASELNTSLTLLKCLSMSLNSFNLLSDTFSK